MDFESGNTHNTTVANCISQESITGTGVWTSNNTFTDYNRTPRTGSWNAFLRYSNQDWMFIAVNLTGGVSYTASVYARQDGATSTDASVAMAYGTAANSASMTEVIAGDTPIIDGNYQLITGAFTPVTTGTYYVGIQGTMNSTPWYISVDDISIIETPSCVSPNSTISNITISSADVSWTAIAGAANYEYVLDTTTTDPAASGTSTTNTTYAATGLNASTTYYFHIRTNCGAGFSAWTTVSFTTLATPPANDACSGAIALTPGGIFTDQDVTGTMLAATTTAGLTPSCQASFSSDVWYSVVVPTAGSITIETDQAPTNSITDSVITVYSGTCGSLTEIGCSDDDGNGFMSLVSVTGRTAGETLYVAVFKYDTTAPTATANQFLVSAYDASLGTKSFNLNGFSAYPNPVKDVLRISYTKDISNIAIHNLLGQEVLNNTVNATQTNVNMSALAKGTYFVKVTVDGLVNTIKVIKE